MAPSGGGAAVDMTLAGNSTSAGAGFILMSSGTITLAGGPNVTLSQNGNAVSISAAAGGGGTQTAISGISVSNTDFTSGTVEIVGSGGGITVGSAAAQKVVLSVAAPVAQTNQTGSLLAISNTFGTSSGTYDARTLSIAGDGIVSVAASNSGFRISASQSVQTQSRFDLTLAGNSTSAGAGFIEMSSGTVTLAGGNNITISQNGNALTISGANVGGAQTGISGIVGSNATYTSGTVTFTGVGGGITVSSNTGQRIDLSVAAQSVQTQGVLSVGVSTGGNSSGNTTVNTGSRLVFAGGNNITVSQGTAAGATTVTISGPNVGGAQTGISGIVASDATYTSGTVTISGVGGGVTINSNTGQRVDISVAAPVAQTNQTGSVFASSNTFGTSSGTYDARTLSVAGSGAVSVAASNSGWVISAPAQSVQTQGVLSVGVSTGGNTSGNTTVNTGSRLVFAGGNNITVSQATAAGATTVTISGPNTAAGGSFSAGVSTLGNTAGSTGVTGTRVVFVGSNNISLSQSTDANGGTVSINGPASSSLSGTGAVSISTNGSTISIGVPISIAAVTLSGNSTSGGGGFALISSGTMVLAGGPNITLSQDGQSISISGASGGGAGFSAGVSTGGNTAGSTGITGSQLVLVGSSPVSLSQSTGANGGTVSINAPAVSSLSATGLVSISTNGSTISIGAPDNSVAFWENIPMAEAIVMTHVSDISKTPFYWGEHVRGRITAKTLGFRLSNVATATLQSFSVHLGVYTLANSTSANLLGSVSEAYVLSTASSASWSGIRNFAITGIGTHATLSTLSAGAYVFGMMFSAGATGSMNQSLMGAGSSGGPLGGVYPGSNQLSSGTSQGIQALFGRGSSTVNAMPANIQASELVNQGQGASNQLRPWLFIRS